MSMEVKKFKPEMVAQPEIDKKLFNDLKFLLLELRTISPFFGILATEMFIAGPSKNVPTIAVSHRGVVTYNEQFMRGLTPGERVAVFVHEALHVSLDYWKRFMGRNWKIANWAHDFVINDIIVKSMSDIVITRKQGREVFPLKVKLPAGGAWSEEYENMSGEEVYNILYEGIAKRAKEIKDQYNAAMADPVSKEAMEREDKINKELRKSLQAAGRLLTEKEQAAIAKTKVAKEALITSENDSFMDALRDRESIAMIDRPEEYVAPEKPEPAPEAKPEQKKAEDKPENEQEKSQDQEKDEPSKEKNDEQSDANDQDNDSSKDKSEDQQQSAEADPNGAPEPGDGQKGDSQEPGDEPGNEPGQEQGKEQGSEPGSEPGQEAGQEPGQEPGKEQGQEGQQGQDGQQGQGSGQEQGAGQPSGQSGGQSKGNGQAASNPQPGAKPEFEPADDQNGNDGAPQENGAQDPNGSPSDQPSAGQPEGGDGNPYDQAKGNMQNAMRDAVHSYMGREKDRISNDVDGTPDGTTREQNLKSLGDELDQIGDQYVDDVTKAREQGHEEPKDDNSQPGQPKPGDKPGEESKEQDGKGEPQPGQKGEGSEGQEGPDGKEGQPQPGEGGKPNPGEGGQPQPGEGQDGQPQPGEGQGQGQVSEKTARNDVQKTLNDMIEEISNSLGGQPQGMKGVDNQMASGKDAIDSEGFDQAMRELAEKLGSGMDGDVDMDCSDIEGNPYANETPERLEERRRNMLTRAIVEDQQQGGKVIGKLPGWLQTEINDILYPPASFAQELEKFIGPYGAMSKRSFAIRNKRNTFMPDHMIRPGMKKNSAKIYILLDTSGSMMNGEDLKNLQHAMGLIEQLALALRLEICVIQSDTEVTRVLNTREAMEEINEKKFVLEGMGGSDFRKSFEYIWREIAVENGNRGNPIIVFTDGMIQVPESVPDGLRQQCLWITNPGQNPPTKDWGEHLIMRDL